MSYYELSGGIPISRAGYMEKPSIQEVPPEMTDRTEPGDVQRTPTRDWSSHEQRQGGFAISPRLILVGGAALAVGVLIFLRRKP
jgi:hypothetical protein